MFALIKQPKLLWSSWHPSKTVDQFSLEEIWACYNFGEQVFDDDGVQIGIKPPLRLVEQYFSSKWRKGPNARSYFFGSKIPPSNKRITAKKTVGEVP